MSEKQTIENGIGKGKPGPGRKKGVPNKINAAVKDMIIGALSDVGGQTYLARQAVENPGPFMTLLGKVLPLDVNASIVAKLLPGSVDDFL